MSAQHLYCPGYLWDGQSLQEDMAVLVENGTVQTVGTRSELEAAYPEAERVDWTGLIMLPGAINAHCHSFQSLLRGFVVDAPFLEWRDRSLYRYAPHLDPEAIYAGALLAFGETLRHGATTVADFFYVHHHSTACDEAVIQAARDLGIRLVFARTMYNWEGAPDAYQETIEEAEARTRLLAGKYQGDPMVTICPAPHSLHGASPDMIQAGHRLARELGTRYHIHVAEEQFEVEAVQREYGCRPVELLERLDVVDESMLAIHLVWLDEREIEILGSRGAKLAYCPSSNMFLADGVTPLPDLLRARVLAGLGTDGACSNNRNSVFEEMRMAALLQKVHRLDATALSARKALEMGTCDGATVLGIAAGRIAPGFHADFVGIAVQDLSLQPAPVPTSALLPNIVYAMQPRAVARVVAGGKEVVRDGKLQTVLEDEIVRKVEAVVTKWPSPEA